MYPPRKRRWKELSRSEQSLKNNKALNDSFVGGMEALKAQKHDDAVAAFTKAAEMDTKQHVVWANLAESPILGRRNQDRR